MEIRTKTELVGFACNPIQRDETSTPATKAGAMAEVHLRDASESPINQDSPVAPTWKELEASVPAGEPMGISKVAGSAFGYLTYCITRRDSLILEDMSLKVLCVTLLLEDFKEHVITQSLARRELIRKVTNSCAPPDRGKPQEFTELLQLQRMIQKKLALSMGNKTLLILYLFFQISHYCHMHVWDEPHDIMNSILH